MDLAFFSCFGLEKTDFDWKKRRRNIMGIDAVRIGVEIRRLLVVSVRRSYRTICRHPFLVGMACFLMLLYRSFPFLFSILVSTSPVLVCTAVLLGTLLSFGKPNLPEIEEDEGAVSHEVSEFKSGIVEDATVVVRDESFSVDRFTQGREDAEEKAEDERSLVEKDVSKVEDHDDGYGDFMPLIDNTSCDIHFENGVTEEVERGLDVSEKRDSQEEISRTKEVSMHDEVSRNHYTLVSNVEDDEKAEHERSLVEKDVSKVEDHDDGYGDFIPLINNTSRDIDFEKGVTKEVERGLDASEKRESQEEVSRTKGVLMHDEVSGNHYTLVSNVEDDENLEGGNDNLPGEFAEDNEGYHLDFSLDWSSKQANDDDHVRGNDEGASDSGSDGAESSSPDASMADILPLLDELHPLLNEAPQPGHVSDDGSDASSEWSHKSKESNVESDDDLARHANEVGDNNEEEEEESHRGKEDESKAAIKWTEDDQKNLMDLGTSELERNQRLESLIARRRARKNMRLMAERNLIDLDGFDIPLNVPPISTSRRNPFDLPYDDDVPGSAPSILMPRQNPFDLPYDSSEEKPDLKGDSFQQEFSAVQHREHVFRRHESFNVGPSGLGVPRQERQGLRWKPYFVPERFATEGTGYHTFERQLSEVSESKLSSVPDTDSVNSAIDEDKKLNEEEVSQGTEVTSNIDLASILVERGSISSEDVNSAYFERAEERDVQHEEDEITLGDIENHHECDSGFPPSPSELNASEILQRMGAGGDEYSSRSSLSSLSEIDEKIADVKKEPTSAEQIISEMEETCLTQNSLDSDFQFVSGKADEYLQFEPVVQTSDFHFTVGIVEHISEPERDDIEDSGISKQTPLESEVELVSVVENEKQEEPASEAREFNSGFFRQTSFESDNNSTSRDVDEVQHKEPTYDSSPSRTDKIISFSSVSSDNLSETLNVSSAPEVTKYADVEASVHADRMEQDTSGDGKMHESFSQVGLSGDNEPKTEEGMEIREGDDTRAGLSGSDADFDGQYVFVNTESVVEHFLVDSLVSSSNSKSATEDVPVMKESWHHEQPQADLLNLDKELIAEAHQDETEKLEDIVIKAEILHHEELQVDSSNLDGELITDAHHDEMEKPDSGSQFQMPSELVKQHSLEENDSADLRLSTSVSESLDECPIAVEETLHVVKDQVHISTTDASNGCETVTEILDPAATSVDAVHSVDLHMSACEEREPQFETVYSVEDQIHLYSTGTSNGFAAETEKLDLAASSVDIVPSADLHISAYEEREPQFEAVQISEAHTGISSSNAHHEEGDSFIMEESTQIELDQVLSSATDMRDNVFDIEQDVNAKDRSMALEESSQNELAKQESPSYDTIVESSFNVQNLPSGHNEQLELSAEETSVDDVEVYHSKDHTTANITSLISDTKCAAHENLEYESKVGTLDLNVNLLGEFVYENTDHVTEHSPVTEENINEIESVIKDIDDGLLSELDAVGDFSVTEANNEMIVSEHFLETSTRSTEIDSLMHNSNLADIKPELPVLEVKSVEDIELAFKQMHEGTDVEEILLPSMLEEQVAVEQFEDSTERISDIHFVEASSLADIDIAMKKFSQGNLEEQPATLHVENEPEKINEVNSAKELPVLEVKTIEDIDLAFKQLHEGADVEEVILPSTIEQQLAVEETRDPGQTSSELQIVEARSVDDIHLAIQQLSQIDVEKQTNTYATNSVEEIEVSRQDAESRTFGATDVSSSNTIEPNSEEAAEASSIEEHKSTAAKSTVNVTITDVPQKPDHVPDEASENLAPSIPEKKEKKKKSHERSGSSSSSSSSSSDSD